VFAIAWRSTPFSGFGFTALALDLGLKKLLLPIFASEPGNGHEANSLFLGGGGHSLKGVCGFLNELFVPSIGSAYITAHDSEVGTSGYFVGKVAILAFDWG
jgi:hypothetical protein